MKTIIITTTIALLLAACGGNKPNVDELNTTDEVDNRDPLAVIHAAVDGRFLDPTLYNYASRTEQTVRLATARAVGSIGDPKGAPILSKLLDDEDLSVQDAAVFSTGLLGQKAPENLVATLEKKLSIETRSLGIEVMLDALGRVGGDDQTASALEFVEDKRPKVQAGAIRTLGILGQRGHFVSDEAAVKIAGHLSDDDELVRFMTAFYLFRAAPDKPGPKEIVPLLEKSALEDPSPQTRAYSLRALAKRGGLQVPIFKKVVLDNSPSVSATAVQSIAFVEDDQKCNMTGIALAAVRTKLEEDKRIADGAFIHTVRSALEAVVTCPVGEELEASLKEVEARLKKYSRFDAGISLCLCLVRLIERADDVTLVSCDSQRPYVGKRMLARSLAMKSNTSSKHHMDILLEMLGDSDPRVAVSAVTALADIDNPEATKAVIDAIKAERALVVTAALDAIATSPQKFANTQGQDNEPGILDLIENAVTRFAPFDNIGAPVAAALLAIKAIGDPAAEPILKKLAADKRPSIRSLVLDVYASIDGIEPPPGLPNMEPVRPVDYKRIASWKDLDTTATIHTTKGVFVIRLLVDIAPVTVDNFVSLAQAGFYNETEIHRVVPNFVVQGGDPTGTGSGDAGYSIRCEANQVRYKRGIVGMALAGKDTGGSQFFVTLSHQPHLNGNYTAFGRVLSGMEVVDTIEQGDYIEQIIVNVE